MRLARPIYAKSRYGKGLGTGSNAISTWVVSRNRYYPKGTTSKLLGMYLGEESDGFSKICLSKFG